jgi:S-formylglutathione hydrolase FrmB
VLSLMSGWIPIAVQLVTAVAVIRLAVEGRRQWSVSTALMALTFGALSIFAIRWLMVDLGVTGEPAPWPLWMWIGLSGCAVALAVARWSRSTWPRRRHSLFATSFCLLSVGMVVNGWIGYYPTVGSAWSQLTDAALPGEVDQPTMETMRDGPPPEHGVVIRVHIATGASGFDARQELVYLPPIWFATDPPPRLPAVMMIGGQFNDPADWLRVGGAYDALEAYASAHHGSAPIAVFVDHNGAFANDTECVNGPRGRADDHLVLDVVPQISQRFGVAADRWGAVGFSSGGTCAVNLAVRHPDTFGAFVDIAGDRAPNVGTRAQTVARLFGDDESAYAAFDPVAVMHGHGAYRDSTGLFIVPEQSSHDAESATTLCDAGRRVGIECAVTSRPGRHVWPFAAAGFEANLQWLADWLLGRGRDTEAG